MVNVRKLLEYNADVRRRYLTALAKLPWDEFVKNREASWHSLRNIFIQTMGAIDHWLDFLQNEKLCTNKKFDDYKSMVDVQAYMERVEGRMRKYLDLVLPDGLVEKYRLTNDIGEDIEVTAEDILIHVFEEEVHHRGELNFLFWQADHDPPITGFGHQ